MTTMYTSPNRCSGFFLVGIMELMKVERGLASWPVSLIGTLIDCGGMGLGILATTLQVLISMYFERYQGAANGIMFAGATVSAATFPKLVLFLSETYGFRGSLLLLGAVLMNMIAVSLAFREPHWIQRDRKRKKG
ncbi:hypothetical protein HPB52_007911 [Rhipicephalus sanguineus]|uniref:Monocarboxylate transporter n=1 Tax=Rhipicephalus sanguineus TaxID=34632 RepID=A0A9D4PW87_RHISA|nr:hypothetical protein HPB52_007911 [Rhipicephalus sanguineus]